MFRLAALLLLLPAFALAGECPVPDAAAREQALTPLLDHLAEAATEAEGRDAEGDVWRFWLQAPDATAQGMLDDGISRIGWADFAGAEKSLDGLVAYCPDYAEGWNQRAFARFLQGDYEGAIEDLDRTLELEPKHFGALSGKALSLIRQGRAELAQQALRAAVALHPWIKERHLLAPGIKT